jgi:hypothetical protein
VRVAQRSTAGRICAGADVLPDAVAAVVAAAADAPPPRSARGGENGTRGGALRQPAAD